MSESRTPKLTSPVVEAATITSPNDKRDEDTPTHETREAKLNRVILETYELVGEIFAEVAAGRVATESRYTVMAANYAQLAANYTQLTASDAQLAANYDMIQKEVRRIATSVALLHTARLEPARPKFESMSDISFDDGQEMKTENGTRKIAYTEDELRAKMRTEYIALQEAAEDKRDAAPKRYIVRVLTPHLTTVAATAAGIGALSYLWKLISQGHL